MFKAETKTGLYIGIFTLLASLFAWGFYTFYKPFLIETSCSEIASNSLNSASIKRNDIYNDLSYDNLKQDCILLSSNSFEKTK